MLLATSWSECDAAENAGNFNIETLQILLIKMDFYMKSKWVGQVVMIPAKQQGASPRTKWNQTIQLATSCTL